MPSDPGFSGELVVDDQRRVITTGTSKRLRKKTPRGYISGVDGQRFEITLTDGKTVECIRCVAQSTDLLSCDGVSNGTTVSQKYYMRRTNSPVNDIPLQGRWKVPYGRLYAELTIDGHGQAVLTVPRNGQPGVAQESGYVWIDGPKAEIIFTDRTKWDRRRLDRYYCGIESRDLLRCSRKTGKAKSNSFFITRQN